MQCSLPLPKIRSAARLSKVQADRKEGSPVWYLRLFVLLAVNLAVLFFALANLGVTVTLHWWNPDSPGTQVNLTLALLVAYLLGFLTFFVISAVRELRLRRRCARLQRQIDGMREELNALRTAPLDIPLPVPSPVAVEDERI